MNEVVLFCSSVRWSLWMRSATHPCIIDGGRKPLANHTRLGFYSKLCPESMLILMSTVSHIMYLCSRLKFCSLVIYCFTLGVSCHITPSFIWHWSALLLTLALVVFMLKHSFKCWVLILHHTASLSPSYICQLLPSCWLLHLFFLVLLSLCDVCTISQCVVSDVICAILHLSLKS